MQLLGWFSTLLLCAAVLAVDAPTELIIETTFMPEECSVKAALGDEIFVHYVSIFVCLLVAWDLLE